MSCTDFDWKAYALGELDRASANEAKSHAAGCAACREELAGVQLTLAAMNSLRDEEMPRRIAFVSDKVFEPKWYQRLWSPNFAAACVVAAAILVHAFAGHPASDAQIQARVDSAVTKAVADVEARHNEQMTRVVEAYGVLQKEFNQVYMRSVGLVRE